MIQYINKLIAKLKSSEKGQGMVEYALIIAFVAAIAIVVLNGKLGTVISGAFDKASQAVDSAAVAATDTSAKQQ
jgi:pilus assembly protein Flp/PilA